MVLVTGASGQLGFDVILELKKQNIDCIGVSSKDLNLTNHQEVEKYIINLNPKIVIHCGAYTAVDNAENEPELCESINTKGTESIAKACKNIDATMIYISTDYIFDGRGTTPFNETSTTNPLGVYGKTKLKGEILVKELLEKYFILRISWVFGLNGNNFVKTMVRLGKEKESLSVVSDQIGSPTYTLDLAKLICHMIKTEKYGIYNVTNDGYCSWADFAKKIMEIKNLNCVVNEIPTSEYKTLATRPLNSRLDKNKLIDNGFSKLPTWEDALVRFLKEF